MADIDHEAAKLFAECIGPNEPSHLIAISKAYLDAMRQLAEVKAKMHAESEAHVRFLLIDHPKALAERDARIAELEVINNNQRSMLEGKHKYVGQDFTQRIKRLETELAAAQELNKLLQAQVNSLLATCESQQRRAARAVPVWQPIETAPKDGEEILVCTAEGCRYVVCYDEIFSAPWRIRNDQGLNKHVPTHWMQPPAAPKEPT